LFPESAAVGQKSQGDATALSFTTLFVANLGLIFANRSWSRTIWSTLQTPNPALWLVLGGTLGFLSLALYVPFCATCSTSRPCTPATLQLALREDSSAFYGLKGSKFSGRNGSLKSEGRDHKNGQVDMARFVKCCRCVLQKATAGSHPMTVDLR